jgi:hypothetical protein
MAIHNDTNIVPFRSRTASAERNAKAWRYASAGTPDKGPGSAAESDQEYRERTRANVLSAIVVAVLVSAGTWTLDSLVEVQQPNHGCFRATGNCNIVEMPVAARSLGQRS